MRPVWGRVVTLFCLIKCLWLKHEIWLMVLEFFSRCFFFEMCFSDDFFLLFLYILIFNSELIQTLLWLTWCITFGHLFPTTFFVGKLFLFWKLKMVEEMLLVCELEALNCKLRSCLDFVRWAIILWNLFWFILPIFIWVLSFFFLNLRISALSDKTCDLICKLIFWWINYSSVHVFVRNIHDHTLPPYVQSMCCKLVMNLIDSFVAVEKSHVEQPVSFCNTFFGFETLLCW